jgi:hypothetical protein
MTDVASTRKRRGPRLALTATAAVCAFLIVLALLAAQLRAGLDPALGTLARSGGASATQPARSITASKSHAAPAPVTKASGG